MNTNNISYAVARATEASRESGEVRYVGFWREEDTFCVAQDGSTVLDIMEWWAAVDQHGLVAFDCEEDYAQWALKMERAYQSHIAATEVSGTHHHFDGDVEFVEV